eukprot:1704266-Karenia_brevis.AAC.1
MLLYARGAGSVSGAQHVSDVKRSGTKLLTGMAVSARNATVCAPQMARGECSWRKASSTEH